VRGGYRTRPHCNTTKQFSLAIDSLPKATVLVTTSALLCFPLPLTGPNDVRACDISTTVPADFHTRYIMLVPRTVIQALEIIILCIMNIVVVIGEVSYDGLDEINFMSSVRKSTIRLGTQNFALLPEN